MTLFRKNAWNPAQKMSKVVTIPLDQYEAGCKATQLLNAMLTHPVHARVVEDIIAEINPNATFPGREAREALRHRQP